MKRSRRWVIFENVSDVDQALAIHVNAHRVAEALGVAHAVGKDRLPVPATVVTWPCADTRRTLWLHRSLTSTLPSRSTACPAM